MICKQFDNWNKEKKLTEEKLCVAQFKQREIFYARVGENVGFEQCGKGNEFIRPVLILKKFNQHVFWGVPLSTTCKQGCYYFRFSFISKKESVAVLSQLKLFDAKRLERKIGMMSDADFEKIKKAIKSIFNDL